MCRLPTEYLDLIDVHIPQLLLVLYEKVGEALDVRCAYIMSVQTKYVPLCYNVPNIALVSGHPFSKV